MFQVVTDESIGLAASEAFRRVDEIVVPATYRTKSGAKFKSRALQYCLEDEVNRLGTTACQFFRISMHLWSMLGALSTNNNPT